MTPAEKLSAAKPWRRSPRNKVSPRKRFWNTRLREVREELRISLKDVAKAVGMSVTAIWQLEMGTDPMLSTARKLASFYGMDVWVLWPSRRKLPPVDSKG